MSVEIVGPEAEDLLDWIELTRALEAGHRLPRAEIGDTFLYRDPDTLLSRAAWIDGLGIAVKSATVFPGNPAKGLARIGGGVSLYSDGDGALQALIDFHLVTKWKTAGDSLLAARYLARPDSRVALIVGAGTVGRSMVAAYRALWPGIEVLIWNRTPATAAALAVELGAEAVENLPDAVARADVILTATMSTDPVLRGDWLRPGQHLDLIGAYRPDMREVDDTALQRARLFVDSRATTLGHIGELKIPIEAGVLSAADVVADFYDIADGSFARTSEDEITICKNGGGAHLDLMTATYILNAWQTR